MTVRFYIDPATDQPHIDGHSVVEDEVEEGDGSRIALGQTEAGRYMRVIYVPDPTPGSVFVITAYELGEKARGRW